MKHFFQKRNLNIFGAGGGPKAPNPPPITQYPGVLAPPQMGCMDTISSFSYAEMIDLLSDGPIEGVVNKFGQKVYDENLKEGIYYNDIVIKETSNVSSIEVPIDFIKKALKDLWYDKDLNGKFFTDENQKFLKEIPFYEIDDSNFQKNFQNPITIESYSPQTSLQAYADAVGASLDNLKLVEKAFSLSPIKTEKIFFTKITIPSFTAALSSSVFDLQEGGDKKEYPIKLSIPNISDYIYFSIGIDDLKSFNYFDLPRSYIFNNILTTSNKETVLKIKKEASIKNNNIFTDFEFFNVNIFLWSIYSEEFGIKDITTVLDRYFEKIIIYQNNSSLYNFPMTNIQVRKGNEIQTPLDNFSCITIDTDYKQELVGPFKVTNNFTPTTALDAGGVQRLKSYQNDSIGIANISLEQETSDDIRAVKAWPVEYDKKGEPYLICNAKPNYAIFDSVSKNRVTQEAFPVTHYVSNQNVESIQFSLTIASLSDTNHADLVDPNLACIGANKQNQADALPCGSPTYRQLPGVSSDSSTNKVIKQGYFLILAKNSCLGGEKKSFIIDGGCNIDSALFNLRCLTNPNTANYSLLTSFFDPNSNTYKNSFTSIQDYSSTPKCLRFRANEINKLYCYLLINQNYSYSLNESIPWDGCYATNMNSFQELLKQTTNTYKKYGFGLNSTDFLIGKSSTEPNILKTTVVQNSFIDYINCYSSLPLGTAANCVPYVFCLVEYCYNSLENLIENKYIASVNIKNLIDPDSLFTNLPTDIYQFMPISLLNIKQENYELAKYVFDSFKPYLSNVSKNEITYYLPSILALGTTYENLKQCGMSFFNQCKGYLTDVGLSTILNTNALRDDNGCFYIDWQYNPYNSNSIKCVFSIFCSLSWNEAYNYCVSEYNVGSIDFFKYNSVDKIISNDCYLKNKVFFNGELVETSNFDFVLNLKKFPKMQNSFSLPQPYEAKFVNKDGVPNAVLPTIRQTITAGSKMPAVVSFKVEVGYESEECNNFYNDGYFAKRYDIYGTVSEAATLDFGNSKYKNIAETIIPPPKGVTVQNKYNALYCNSSIYLVSVSSKINGVENKSYFIHNSINFLKNRIFGSTSLPFDICDLSFDQNKNLINNSFSNKIKLCDNNLTVSGNYIDLICNNQNCVIGEKSKYFLNSNNQLLLVSDNLIQDFCTNLFNYLCFQYNYLTPSFAQNSIECIFDKNETCDFNKINLINFYNYPYNEFFSCENRKIVCLYTSNKSPVQSFSFSKSKSLFNPKDIDTYEIYDNCSYSLSSNALKIEISNFIFDEYSLIDVNNLNLNTSKFSFGCNEVFCCVSQALCDLSLNSINLVLYSVDNDECATDTQSYSELSWNRCITTFEKELKISSQSDVPKKCLFCNVLKTVYPEDLILDCGKFLLRLTLNNCQTEDFLNFQNGCFSFFIIDQNNVNKKINPSILNPSLNKTICCNSICQFITNTQNDFVYSNLAIEISDFIFPSRNKVIDLRSTFCVGNTDLIQNFYKYDFINYGPTECDGYYFGVCSSSYVFASSKVSVPIIDKQSYIEGKYITTLSNGNFNYLYKIWLVENIETKNLDIFLAKQDSYISYNKFSESAYNYMRLNCFYCGFKNFKGYLNCSNLNENVTKFYTESYASCLFGVQNNPFDIQYGCFAQINVGQKTEILICGGVDGCRCFGGIGSRQGLVCYNLNLTDQFGTIKKAGFTTDVAKIRKEYSTYKDGKYSYFEYLPISPCSNVEACFSTVNYQMACYRKTSIPLSSVNLNSPSSIAASVQSHLKSLGYIPYDAYIKNSRESLRVLNSFSSLGNFRIMFADYVVSNAVGDSYSNQLLSDNKIYLPKPRYKKDGSTLKRYVKFTRLSHETLSSLISKRIILDKVSEIIPQNFSYPFSAIVGNKIDSRSFSEIPERTYDCKLKKVLVPSNYFPLDEKGNDVRYLKGNGVYKIYDGDWDGTFKLMWTNNPAWILMDILINKRYGLGSYIESNQVDIWELYKIARWCDGVDENGYYYGVPDGYNLGSVEPRHTFNAIISEKFNVFDMINQIASVFRGHVFYMNSLITFDDDRIKPPIGTFTNYDVKDGLFNYTNFKKDEEFTALELGFLDSKDSFKPKKEYVEDSDGIKTKGLLKKELNLFGITSRGQARRFGKHVLFHTAKENLNVQFTTDMKALLYRPGDLISIHDELMSSIKNFGVVKKVLNINKDLFQVVIDKCFDPNVFDVSEITLFTPVGKPKYDDIFSKSLPIPKTILMSEAGMYNFYPKFSGQSYLNILNPDAAKTITFSRSTDKDLNNTYYYESKYNACFIDSENNCIIKEIQLSLNYIPEKNILDEYKKYGHWEMSTNLDKNLFKFDSITNPEIKFEYPHKKYFFEYFDTGEYLYCGNEKIQNITGTNLNGVPLFGSNFISKKCSISENEVKAFNFSIPIGGYEKPKISYYDVIESDKPSIDTFYITGSGANDSGYFVGSCNGQEYSILTLSKYTKDGSIKQVVNEDNGGLENLIVGSPFSLKIINKNPNVFKIMQITENYINEYSISATQFNLDKFKEIEENYLVDDISNTFNALAGFDKSNDISNVESLIKSPIITALNPVKYDNLSALEIKWFFETKNINNANLSIILNVLSPSNKTIQVVNGFAYNEITSIYSYIFDLSKFSKTIEVGSYTVRIQVIQKDENGNVIKTSPFSFKTVTVLTY